MKKEQLEKPTTRKQFQYYCKQVEYWLKELGLLEWTVYYLWQNLDCMAEIRYDTETRAVTFVLAKRSDNQTRYDLTHSALHEVLHLVHADFAVAGKRRWQVSLSEFNSYEEAVVCRLTQYIMASQKKIPATLRWR